MSRRLEAAASRARKSGLSGGKGPRKTRSQCPLAKGAGGQQGSKAKNEQHYEECVLQELVVEINDGSKAQTITLNQRRTSEKVQPNVADAYKGTLANYDLVVEALSAIDIGHKSKHLRVNAQAFAAARHASWQPLHPRTELGAKLAADGGAPCAGEFPVAGRDGALQNWLAIWPFSGERTQFVPIIGEACGHTKPGAGSTPGLSQLSVQMVVFPQEEWTLSLKTPKSYGRSKSMTGDFKRLGEKGADVWTSTTVTVKTERGAASNTVSTTTSSSQKYRSVSEMLVNADGSSAKLESISKGDSYQKTSLAIVGKDGHGESIAETYKNGEYSETLGLSQTSVELPIGSKTYSISQTDSTDKGLGKVSEKNRYKVDDTFSLTVKSAGETATFDPAKIVENIYKVADIFKDISQLFSAIKVGWSVSYDFSLFQGTLNLGWGMRWPAAYKENARVWYVERYLTASGDIKLVEGSLTASVGLSFDWGWLPAGVVAEIAASLKAVVQVTPTVNIVYTNPADGLADIEREVPVKFEITFSGTATGSARAFGFSRVLKGAADAKFTASGKWALSTLRTPSLKASVKFDGLVLTGYFESSAEDPHRANMKPIKLLEPRVIMEEREFWS